MLINIKKQQKRDIMAEMKEEHFEVVSSNKAREYEKTKKTQESIQKTIILTKKTQESVQKKKQLQRPRVFS